MFKKDIWLWVSNIFKASNTLLGLLIAIFGLYISYLGLNREAKSQISIEPFIPQIILTISIVLLAIFLLTFIRHIYTIRKRRVATDFVSYNLNKVLTDEEIIDVDRNKLGTVEKNCLNRIIGETNKGEYWHSSWFGAGCYESNTDKVNSIIVQDGKNVTGKVPFVEDFFFQKKKKMFNIKFEHYEGGYWDASIYGVSGKPSNKQWVSHTHDINQYEYICFWIRSYDTIESPGAELPDNIHGYPLIYIRFFDEDFGASDSVIFTVPNYWTYMKIPMTKFSYHRNLYKNYNQLTKRNYFLAHGAFQETKVKHVLFGCSESMPSETSSLLIFDIKFK